MLGVEIGEIPAIRYSADEWQTHEWSGAMFIDGERLAPLRDTYRRVGDCLLELIAREHLPAA